MTSFQTKRCRHCNDVYNFQASGHGCFDEPNNDRYCPRCWSAILETLSKIRTRYESVWVESPDYTVGELIAIEKTRADEVAKAGGIAFQRVSMPLFCMSDSDNHNVTGIVNVDGKSYEYRYWTKRNEGEYAPKVSMLMQKDQTTGALTPWIDYR